jgi:hypothetical protein
VIETSRQNYKIIAILIATIAAGLPIWTQSLRQIDFTDPNFLMIWLAVGIFGAFTTLLFVNLKTWDMVTSFIVGYMIAVILHFIAGILILNFIHAQLAISLLIAMGVGIICGISGSYIWIAIKWKTRK